MALTSEMPDGALSTHCRDRRSAAEEGACHIDIDEAPPGRNLDLLDSVAKCRARTINKHIESARSAIDIDRSPRNAPASDRCHFGVALAQTGACGLPGTIQSQSDTI
jgi:hypothetical protein